MRKMPCLFYGKPAILLCDGLIGFDADEDENGMMMNCRGMFTCDAPMCQDCATWHGNIFFFRQSGGMETKDYCPLCEVLYQSGERIRVAPHRKDFAIPEPCLAEAQTDIIRKAHWNSDLNNHRRQLSSIQGGGQQCLPF